MMAFKKTIKIIFLFSGIMCSSSLIYAQGTKIPGRASGYVNDYAQLLTSTDKKVITTYATELEQKTSAEIAIVTVETTQPDSIQGYSVRLFDQWKIGKKGKDNGLLILVAVKDRNALITTGYGLEGAIPDYTANKVVNEVMIPYFKQNNYSKGIKEGAITSISLIAKEYNMSITGQESLAYSRVHTVERKKSFIEVLFTIIFIIMLLTSRSGLLTYFLFGSLTGSGRRRGGYWYGSGFGGSSGGFGGGFGGFGGGMTGGGGGGGSW